MNWRRWKLSALLAGAVMAGTAAAQAPGLIIPASPPGCAVPSLGPISPAPSPSPAPGTAPPQNIPPAQDVSNMPADQGQAAEGGNVFASGLSYTEGIATPAGVGLTTATTVTAAGGGRFTAMAATTPTPLILPGLFTAINVESALPHTRVFMEYGYFDGFQTSNPKTGIGLVHGFNLNAFYVGGELAFMDNRASVYVRVPFLDANENTVGASVDGLGDVSFGFKYALLSCQETGSTLSVGLTVATPTAPGLTVPINSYIPSGFTPSGTAASPNLPPTRTASINPAYIQPWVGGLAVLDRLILSSYAAVILPTDDSVSSFINGSVGIGYQLYRCEGSDSWLTSITPTVSAQVLLPMSHQGTPQGNLGFAVAAPTVAPGTTPIDRYPPADGRLGRRPQRGVSSPKAVAIGLGRRALLTIGVVEPVGGPKAYTVGVVAGLNFFF